MIPTQDPYVFIEEQHDGYVRYQQRDSEDQTYNIIRRWEVYGNCVGVANCVVGSIVDDEFIETIERAKEVWSGHTFIHDCPITPEFRSCCSFEYVELEV